MISETLNIVHISDTVICRECFSILLSSKQESTKVLTILVEKYIIYLSAINSLRIITQTHQTNQIDILLPITSPKYVHTYSFNLSFTHTYY